MTRFLFAVLFVTYAIGLRGVQADAKVNLFAPTFKGREEFLKLNSTMEWIWKNDQNIFDPVTDAINKSEDQFIQNSTQFSQRVSDLQRLLKLIAKLKKDQMHDEINSAVPELKIRIARLEEIIQIRINLFKAYDKKIIGVGNLLSSAPWPELDGLEKLKANSSTNNREHYRVQIKNYIPYFIQAAKFADIFIRRIKGMKIPFDEDVMAGFSKYHERIKILRTWIDDHQKTEISRAIFEQRTLPLQDETIARARAILDEAKEQESRFVVLSDGKSYWYDPILNNVKRSTFAHDVIDDGLLYEDQIEKRIKDKQFITAAIQWFIFRYGLSIAIEANKTFKDKKAEEYVSSALERAASSEADIRANIVGNAILDKFKLITGNYFVQRPEWE